MLLLLCLLCDYCVEFLQSQLNVTALQACANLGLYFDRDLLVLRTFNGHLIPLRNHQDKVFALIKIPDGTCVSMRQDEGRLETSVLACVESDDFTRLCLSPWPDQGNAEHRRNESIAIDVVLGPQPITALIYTDRQHALLEV